MIPRNHPRHSAKVGAVVDGWRCVREAWRARTTAFGGKTTTSVYNRKEAEHVVACWAYGTVHRVTYWRRVRTVACKQCGGYGMVATQQEYATEPCPACSGAGQREER